MPKTKVEPIFYNLLKRLGEKDWCAQRLSTIGDTLTTHLHLYSPGLRAEFQPVDWQLIYILIWNLFYLGRPSLANSKKKTKSHQEVSIRQVLVQQNPGCFSDAKMKVLASLFCRVKCQIIFFGWWTKHVTQGLHKRNFAEARTSQFSKQWPVSTHQAICSVGIRMW